MVLDVPTVEIRCRKFHETELGEEGHETDGYFSVASFRIRATPHTDRHSRIQADRDQSLSPAQGMSWEN